MTQEIESESKFVWRQIKFLLMLPFLLIMVLFGKRKSEEIFTPFKDFFHFIFEGKMTISLIFLNIIVFFVEIFYLGSSGVMKLAFKPEDIINLNILNIIASIFLHASWIHLTGNMLFLFIFGRIVEKRFGGTKFLLIYFGSALISTIVSAFFMEGGIGASGAIAGLISTAILINPFYLTYLIAGIPLPIILVGWLAILADVTGILVSQNDNIGHFAHLGGYVAISIIMFLLNKNDKEDLKIGFIINMIFAVIMILLINYFDLSKILSILGL